MQSQNDKNDPGKLFNITVIQLYAPTTKAKEAEVEWMVLWKPPRPSRTNTKIKDVLFITDDWNAQELPGLTGKFGLPVNEAGNEQMNDKMKQGKG